MEPEDGFRSQTGPKAKEAFIPADDAGRILFIGRSKLEGTAREFDMACTAFRFEITGPAKEVYMEMSGRTFSHEMLGYIGKDQKMNACGKSPGMMKSYVDGKPVKRMIIADGQEAKQYLLAENIPAGKHTIFVSKCSEFPFGVLKFHGLVVPEGCEVTAPPAKKIIEIIGDSNSTGPGGVGPNSYDHGLLQKMMMKWTDTTTSWASHLSAAFDVDHYILGCSGLGFMANAEKLPHGPMLDIYGRILENESSEYDGEMNHVDLCIVYLGGNDWIGGGMAGKDEEAIAGYKRLIELIRSKRGPSVPILCLYPDAYSQGSAPGLKQWSRMMQKAFHVNVKKWVLGAVARTGGENDHIYARVAAPVERISGGGDADFGMMGHWNAEGGRKFSTGVVPLVREITKWPAASEQAPTQKVMDAEQA